MFRWEANPKTERWPSAIVIIVLLLLVALVGCSEKKYCWATGVVRVVRAGSGSQLSPIYTVVRLKDGTMVTVKYKILGAAGDTVSVAVKCDELRSH